MAPQRRDDDVREIPPGYNVATCEWGGCPKLALRIRDTKWGDLFVCMDHAHAPLDGDETPSST